MTDQSHAPSTPPRLAKILVPFDFSEQAVHALSYAKALADRFGSSLDLLYVVSDPYLPNAILPINPDLPLVFQLPAGFVEGLVKDAERRLGDAVSPADRAKYRITSSVAVGDPRQEILQRATADKADLIVMGTHGRKGASHLILGSVAERVVRAAPCAVLTVR